MRKNATISIYGDSLMKGTVLRGGRYRSTMRGYIAALEQRFPMRLVNNSRFGITIDKGRCILLDDIATGPPADYALLEYGGNDCNFDWPSVAEQPECEHLPVTPPLRFDEILNDIICALKQKGVQPVLMTLPPIDADKYFDFIVQSGCDTTRLLKWLGDKHAIYRFHEMYSSAIANIARQTDSLLIDARSWFLDKRCFRQLIGGDGLHPTEAGYRLMADNFSTVIEHAFSGAAMGV